MTRMTKSPVVPAGNQRDSVLLCLSADPPVAEKDPLKLLPRYVLPPTSTCRSRSFTTGLAAGEPGASVQASVTLNWELESATWPCIRYTCPVRSRIWLWSSSIRGTPSKACPRSNRPQPWFEPGRSSPPPFPVRYVVELTRKALIIAGLGGLPVDC